VTVEAVMPMELPPTDELGDDAPAVEHAVAVNATTSTTSIPGIIFRLTSESLSSATG
jgi:hypothetical protein